MACGNFKHAPGDPCCPADCPITEADLPLVEIDGATLDPTPFAFDAEITQFPCCFIASLDVNTLDPDGIRIDGGEVVASFPGSGINDRFIGHYRLRRYDVILERRDIVCGEITYQYCVEVRVIYEASVGLTGYTGTFDLNTSTNWFCTGIFDSYCTAKPELFEGQSDNRGPGAAPLIAFVFRKLFEDLPTGTVTFDACEDVSECEPLLSCVGLDDETLSSTCDNEFCDTYDVGTICFAGPTSVDVTFSGP